MMFEVAGLGFPLKAELMAADAELDVESEGRV